jgi:hypothetical protein
MAAPIFLLWVWTLETGGFISDMSLFNTNSFHFNLQRTNVTSSFKSVLEHQFLPATTFTASKEHSTYRIISNMPSKVSSVGASDESVRRLAVLSLLFHSLLPICTIPKPRIPSDSYTPDQNHIPAPHSALTNSLTRDLPRPPPPHQ